MLLQWLGNLLTRIFVKETMLFCSLLNGPLCRLNKLTSRCSETNSIAAVGVVLQTDGHKGLHILVSDPFKRAGFLFCIYHQNWMQLLIWFCSGRYANETYSPLSDSIVETRV